MKYHANLTVKNPVNQSAENIDHGIEAFSRWIDGDFAKAHKFLIAGLQVVAVESDLKTPVFCNRIALLEEAGRFALYI